MYEKTMISFSFDDGRKDNIDLAKNFLLPENIPATFNVTTGYVDGTAPDCVKTDVPPMTANDVKWLYSQNIFEIALHGDKHQNDAVDVETARVKLCEWLNISDNTEFGFASPFSVFNSNNYDKYFDTDKITYIRIGDNQNGKSALKAKAKMQKLLDRISKKDFISRVLNRYIDTKFFIKRQAVLSGKDSMVKRIDGKIIYSIPIFKGVSPYIIDNYIKYAIRKKLSIVLMFHSVSDEDSNLYTYKKSDFVKICENLIKLRNNKKCRIVTVKELYDKVKKGN